MTNRWNKILSSPSSHNKSKILCFHRIPVWRKSSPFRSSQKKWVPFWDHYSRYDGTKNSIRVYQCVTRSWEWTITTYIYWGVNNGSSIASSSMQLICRISINYQLKMYSSWLMAFLQMRIWFFGIYLLIQFLLLMFSFLILWKRYHFIFLTTYSARPIQIY